MSASVRPQVVMMGSLKTKHAACPAFAIPKSVRVTRLGQTKSWVTSHYRTSANPSDVYVFNLEGVICEEDGKTYGNTQQLQSFEAPFYITSSLNADRLSSLLMQAGLKLATDSPQVFAGLTPDTTAETLRKITDRPVVKETGARLNFLSGSSNALQKAQSEQGLEKLRLYLAGWSQEGQQSRGKVDGVTELDEKQFSELLSWGLIMGVDDGCGDDN